MDLGLKGLRAIVTGGSKGIGRRAADMLADEGCHVAICARTEADVEATVAALKAKGVDAYGEAIDVTDKAALEGFTEASAKTLGGIDIVVANVSALAMEDDEEGWRKQYETDMLHTVRTVTAAMPHLEASKHPSITIVSSVSGREIDFTGPAYGAMKAALIHYAQGLAYRLAPKMIRVNAVSPGNVYFRGRHLAVDRREQRRFVQAGDGAQSDRSNGNRRRGRPGASCFWPARHRASPPAQIW